MEVSAPQRTALRICWCVAALLMAIFTLQVATSAAGPDVTKVFMDYLYNFLLFAGAGFCLWRAVAVREERLPWLVVGFAIVSWTAADIFWTAVYADDPNAPYPSIADALWLTWYPASLVALVLLVRSRLRNARASLWLDGLIGAVATTALAAALAYGPVIHEGSAGDLSAAVLTGLAYPIGDLLLLGMITAIFGLTSWNPGRAWLVLGLGLALNAVGDAIYLVQTADGTWNDNSWVNALWPASSLLVGLAAWQPIRRASALEGSQPAGGDRPGRAAGLARSGCWRTTTSPASTG